MNGRVETLINLGLPAAEALAAEIVLRRKLPANARKLTTAERRVFREVRELKRAEKDFKTADWLREVLQAAGERVQDKK